MVELVVSIPAMKSWMGFDTTKVSATRLHLKTYQVKWYGLTVEREGFFHFDHVIYEIISDVAFLLSVLHGIQKSGRQEPQRRPIEHGQLEQLRKSVCEPVRTLRDSSFPSEPEQISSSLPESGLLTFETVRIDPEETGRDHIRSVHQRELLRLQCFTLRPIHIIDQSPSDFGHQRYHRSQLSSAEHRIQLGTSLLPFRVPAEEEHVRHERLQLVTVQH